MEELKLPNATLELGRKIVNQLGLEPGVDTLAKWMAHDLAEQIQRCEKESGENRDVAFKECRETILRLWGHLLQGRQRLPALETYDHVLRTLTSLNAEAPRYLRTYRRAELEEENYSETDRWLKVAEELDYTAQILIDFALTNAIENAEDEETRDWLDTAKKAEALNSDFGAALRTICQLNDERGVRNAEEQKSLEKYLKRLKEFRVSADELENDLHARLEALQSKL